MNGEQDKKAPPPVHKGDPERELDKKAPPPVHKGDPERELEQELREHPDDLDKKADVGSDESMDASDPPAAAQPGQSDDPVPSSGFPEKVAPFPIRLRRRNKKQQRCK